MISDYDSAFEDMEILDSEPEITTAMDPTAAKLLI